MMTACCDTHDYCYDTCNRGKEECDKDLQQCLLNMCSKMTDDLNMEEQEGTVISVKQLASIMNLPFQST